MRGGPPSTEADLRAPSTSQRVGDPTLQRGACDPWASDMTASHEVVWTRHPCSRCRQAQWRTPSGLRVHPGLSLLSLGAVGVLPFREPSSDKSFGAQNLSLRQAFRTCCASDSRVSTFVFLSRPHSSWFPEARRCAPAGWARARSGSKERKHGAVRQGRLRTHGEPICPTLAWAHLSSEMEDSWGPQVEVRGVSLTVW